MVCPPPQTQGSKMRLPAAFWNVPRSQPPSLFFGDVPDLTDLPRHSWAPLWMERGKPLMIMLPSCKKVILQNVKMKMRC